MTSGVKVGLDVLMVIAEIEIAREEEVHELLEGEVGGDSEGRVLLVEVELGDGGTFWVPVGHDQFGLRVEAANRQFIDVGVRVEDPGLALGPFEELEEGLHPALGGGDFGPGHSALSDVAVRGGMTGLERAGFPEDLDDEFLGEVGADLLMRADEDVVFGGVPRLPKGLHGLGMDEGGNHATIGPGMQEAELRAQREFGGDGNRDAGHGGINRSQQSAWLFLGPD